MQRIFARTENFWWLAAIAAIIFVFSSGYNDWNSRPDFGHFYQEQYAPAVAFACTGQMADIVGKRPPELSEFLSRRKNRVDCNSIFPLPTGASLSDIKQFHHQIIGSLYTFGGIWKFAGLSWSVTAAVAGALKALFLLGLTLLGSLMMPRIVAIGVALVIVAVDTTASQILPHLRDFSKAAFFALLLYLLVKVFESADRRQIVLSIASALVLCITLGFRQDFQLFIYFFLMAILASAMMQRKFRNAMISALAFIAVITLFNNQVFNFWSTLDRNVFHFYFLGQNRMYLSALSVDSDMFYTLSYKDLYAYTATKIFATAQGADAPMYGTPGYDETGKQAFLLTIWQFPADAAAKAITAFHRTLFGWLSADAVIQVLAALGSFTALLYFLRQRALVFLVPIAFFASITFIQYHPRHFFVYGSIGMLLMAGALWSLAAGLVVRGRARPTKSLYFGMLPAAAVVLCAATLLPLRVWQQSNFDELLAKLDSMPKNHIWGQPSVDPTNAKTPFRLSLDLPYGENLRYARLRLAGCAKPLTLTFDYGQAKAPFDWDQTVVLPAQTAVLYFPVLQGEGNTFAALRMDENTRACFRSLEEITLPADIYPGFYWTREAPGETHRYSATAVGARVMDLFGLMGR
ncbi:hypothetical protein [Mesorhizobium sp. ZC-5]|uniref:hypothetical protein n=1 Tax=Mesorhizobium sp. ZC-5 TaxID=2986066 RepID=UPI0021E7FBA1|nr:hypothetical protein [Mesorhizobium sp. ZC-5]MCV3243688.1 hypothetical protein [Mesorhizobium sp. ZC-5]